MCLGKNYYPSSVIFDETAELLRQRCFGRRDGGKRLPVYENQCVDVEDCSSVGGDCLSFGMKSSGCNDMRPHSSNGFASKPNK
jgi:hypothetical protein